MDTDTLLTIREAATEIGVSESAIRNATLEGRLPFVMKFGRKLIERDMLEAYRSRTQPSGTKVSNRPRRPSHSAPIPVKDGQKDGKEQN